MLKVRNFITFFNGNLEFEYEETIFKPRQF